MHQLSLRLSQILLKHFSFQTWHKTGVKKESISSCHMTCHPSPVSHFCSRVRQTFQSIICICSSLGLATLLSSSELLEQIIICILLLNIQCVSKCLNDTKKSILTVSDKCVLKTLCSSVCIRNVFPNINIDRQVTWLTLAVVTYFQTICEYNTHCYCWTITCHHHDSLCIDPIIIF